ncbi:flagellar assembly protein FliH [Burkholderia sp. RF2-non_BP3]|uniref:flagellar assembly protein FliH n=1 Tax=Burkholderia sp. RF2-non_BP3 TaxID=1637844 RepID=UPI000754D026|nr:flagellar assembly protein FliH [Burkholderia sp. RF2-non_BP3]KUY54595.1 flagellar assembly protein FliH [Burkholderia sp. RF2-non_BP3]
MKTYQRYRFPPLRSPGTTPLPAGALASAAEPLDPAFDARIEAGYRQGMADGYRAGFERGEADGLRQGRATGAQDASDALRSEHAGTAEVLDAMRDAFGRMHAEYLAARRTELVDLVARVARQVIRCELTLQPGQMAALIDETLALMPAASGIPEVRLHPDECARLFELFPERAQQWRLVPDARLEAGECRVLLGGNEADAGCRHRFESCMERVGEQLFAAPNGEVPVDTVAPTPASGEGRS